MKKFFYVVVRSNVCTSRRIPFSFLNVPPLPQENVVGVSSKPKFRVGAFGRRTPLGTFGALSRALIVTSASN